MKLKIAILTIGLALACTHVKANDYTPTRNDFLKAASNQDDQFIEKYAEYVDQQAARDCYQRAVEKNFVITQELIDVIAKDDLIAHNAFMLDCAMQNPEETKYYIKEKDTIFAVVKRAIVRRLAKADCDTRLFIQYCREHKGARFFTKKFKQEIKRLLKQSPRKKAKLAYFVSKVCGCKNKK